ncbi:hypothetical protein MCP1_150041 [Candidatus Terasakiella magnetica]|nr:hypothetical protein MCP1_150041 [Candidatus Terasakiella magnetica]
MAARIRERGSLVAAIVVALLVTFVFVMAMVNCIWRTRLVELQTLAGGLAVLAAALFSHDGQTATAREARRKDLIEKGAVIKNIRLKAEHAASMVCDAALKELSDLSLHSNSYGDEFIDIEIIKNINIKLPDQLSECWDSIDVLPEDGIVFLRRVTSSIRSLEVNINFASKFYQNEFHWYRTAHIVKDIFIHAHNLCCLMHDMNNSLPVGSSVESESEKDYLAQASLPPDIAPSEGIPPQ